MKHIIIVNLYYGYDEFLAERYKGKVEIMSGLMQFYLEENSDDLKELMRYIEIKKSKYSLSHGLYLEKDEKQKIPYYNVLPVTPKRMKDSRGYGVRFSFGCEVCGYHAVQLDLACFRTKYAKGYDFFKVDPLLIISKKMKEALENIGATGYELREVMDDKTKEITPDFFQLVITSYLPPSDKRWIDKLRICRKCERESLRFMGPPGYKLEDFKDKKDFYFTSERTFFSSIYLIPIPYIIVSRRILELLRDCELEFVRAVYFEELCR